MTTWCAGDKGKLIDMSGVSFASGGRYAGLTSRFGVDIEGSGASIGVDRVAFLKNQMKDKIPNSESLKDTFARVIPYYKKNIEPLLSSKKNILIAAHGNSLRALCKKLFNISNKKIVDFEIPTGNPLLIIFEENLKINRIQTEIKHIKKPPCKIHCRAVLIFRLLCG